MYVGSGWTNGNPVTGLLAENDYAHASYWDFFGCHRTGYHKYFHTHSYNYPAYLIGGHWEHGSDVGCFAVVDYGDAPYWYTIGCRSASN